MFCSKNKKGLTTGIQLILTKKTRLKNHNLNKTSIKSVMTKKPISVVNHMLAAKALRIMNEKKITSLCVHKNNKIKKTIGLLHIHHLLDSNIE